MNDLLALITLMFWPGIPLFWIPVHVATNFFRRFGIAVFLVSGCIWLPVAYSVYNYRSFLLQSKIVLPMVLNLAGIPLLFTGILLQILTARLLGIGIIGIPEISSSIKMGLVAKGPFAVVRHPTYFSHTLMFLGVFLITGVTSVGIITLLDFLVVNIIIIPLEERELSKRFGEEYQVYKKKVPSRFLPWVY